MPSMLINQSTMWIGSVVRKTLHSLLALAMININIFSSGAQAQTVFDINPPTIEVEALTEGIAGETQVFTALVKDDLGIRDVKLYYRFSGQQAFSSVPMNAIGESDYYSTGLSTRATENRSIEYYLQARDNGGNRTVRGYAFEPLVRELSPPDSSLTTTPKAQAQTQPPVVLSEAPPTNQTSSGGGFKWWYVALGVLTLGALAASASGGSSSGENTPTATVVFSIGTPE